MQVSRYAASMMTPTVGDVKGQQAETVSVR
jgi:hypothetical protein